MKYINQLDYSHITYPTDIGTPNSPLHQGTVKEVGCGPCCLCMMIDQLTMKRFSLRQCIALSIKHGANHSPGTDMQRLGPVVAEAFGLSYEATDDIRRAVRRLQAGARVIANVGGDQDNGAYKGVFSHCGHYILLISVDEQGICLLDSSWREDKYLTSVQEGKVAQKGKIICCPLEVLDQDAQSRSPRYHIFARNE